MEKNELFDIGKIMGVITGSTILGVFLGSRSGGTYVFEIGPNLLIGLVIFMILATSLAIANLWMSKDE